ncbi:MAG TPA: MFS transporter [Anaerolineales bacterium]|nr:MFS transporter [Anaerolineales bacterium]HRF48551.1 MFS transporter [Anaerolineales bacterium]
MTTAEANLETPSATQPLKALPLGAIALAHASVDIQTSALPILLPQLLIALDLNYALAAGIVSANAVVIAIAQPLFGLLGDRRPLRWLAPLGVLVCGAGLALVPVAGLGLQSYALVIAAVILSGLGSAAFHPEGLAGVRQVSGSQRSTGSSVFFFGNLGFALGPILAGALLDNGGLSSITLLGAIPIVTGTLLLSQQKAYRRPHGDGKHAVTKRQAAVGLVAYLMLLIIVRQTVTSGLTTFIPLYFHEHFGSEAAVTAGLVSVLSLASTVGTLFSGAVADRLGRRAVMVGSMVIVLGALLLFINTSGVLQIAALAIAGAALTAPWTLSVVMVQDAMPGQPGLASGLTLGTAYSGISLAVYALGLVADNFGLDLTMTVVIWMPALAAALSLWVPNRVPQVVDESPLSG